MKVLLNYFNPRGKWKYHGDYVTTLPTHTIQVGPNTFQAPYLHEIWAELRKMLDAGIRPGLVDGRNTFLVTVEVPEHPHNHPHMIIADDLYEAMRQVWDKYE